MTQKTGPEGALLELPVPDFQELTAEMTIELNLPSGKMQLQDVYLLADYTDEAALIKIVSRTANTVEVSVGELDGYRVLTFLDAAYPGWRAYIDGVETPILLADDAFKAVVVPPGTHTVRFEFHPRTVYAGVAISIASIAAALAMVVLLRPRERDGETPSIQVSPEPRDYERGADDTL